MERWGTSRRLVSSRVGVPAEKERRGGLAEGNQLRGKGKKKKGAESAAGRSVPLRIPDTQGEGFTTCSPIRLSVGGGQGRGRPRLNRIAMQKKKKKLRKKNVQGGKVFGRSELKFLGRKRELERRRLKNPPLNLGIFLNSPQN